MPPVSASSRNSRFRHDERRNAAALKKTIDVHVGNAAVKIYTAASITDAEPILDRIRELLHTNAEVDHSYTRSLPLITKLVRHIIIRGRTTVPCSC